MKKEFTPKDLAKKTANVKKDELSKQQDAEDAAKKQRKPAVDELCNKVWEAGVEQKFDGANVKEFTFTIPANTDALVKKDAEVRLTEKDWVVEGDDEWKISAKTLKSKSKCRWNPLTWFRR